MQRKKSIRSLLFLFALLFSFTLKAYNTLHTEAGPGTTLQKTIFVSVPSDNSPATDNLVFEEQENENDADNLFSLFVLVLTSQDHSFHTYYSSTRTFSPVTLLQPPSTPVYISNGVLLI